MRVRDVRLTDDWWKKFGNVIHLTQMVCSFLEFPSEVHGPQFKSIDQFDKSIAELQSALAFRLYKAAKLTKSLGDQWLPTSVSRLFRQPSGSPAQPFNRIWNTNVDNRGGGHFQSVSKYHVCWLVCGYPTS
jgi:hypothetical protein